MRSFAPLHGLFLPNPKDESMMMKMKTPPVAIHATIGLLCCFGSSCLNVTYTRIKDEPRREVRFTSTKSARTFYDAYAAVGTHKIKDGKKRNISVKAMVILPYWQNSKSTENVKFNAAVQTADADQNGTVSEKEARTYADAVAEEKESMWLKP